MKIKIFISIMIGAIFYFGIFSLASALNVEVVNNSGHANVWVMAIGNDGTTSIGLTTPTPLNNLPKNSNSLLFFTLDRLIAGRIYFSLDQPMPAEKILDPANPNVAAVRYDWVELTEDGSPSASVNLTAVDQFGVPLSLRTYAAGKQMEQAGYCKTADVIKDQLTNLSANAIIRDGGNFIRALSPIKSNTYPSFQPYINSVKGQAMTIKGHFFGQPQTDYNYTGTIDSASGDVNLTSAADGTRLRIPGNTLSDAIYTTNGIFYVNGAEWNTARNDVNAAVYRDVMTGFNLGYFGAENDSSKWAGLKPFQNGNGNPYAKVIHEGSDSYGYSYSDNSNKVLLSLDPAKVDTLKITILGDNATDGCSRPSMRLATGNFDGNNLQQANLASASGIDGTSNSRIRDDLVGATSNGQVYFAVNATSHTWQQLPGALAQVASGDLNGDGNYDIFGLTDSGQIYHTQDLTNWQWLPGQLSQIAACDLDGDQLQDLLGVTSEGFIYYTLDVVNWQVMPGLLKQLTCADLDGDGFGDVAGVTPSGDIYYTVDRANWQQIPGNLAQLTAGYMDSDSKADLVGLAYEGQIFYTMDLLNWIRVPGKLSQIAIGEFNSDLQGDLIGLTSTGEVYYTEDLTNWTQLPGEF